MELEWSHNSGSTRFHHRQNAAITVLQRFGADPSHGLHMRQLSPQHQKEFALGMSDDLPCQIIDTAQPLLANIYLPKRLSPKKPSSCHPISSCLLSYPFCYCFPCEQNSPVVPQQIDSAYLLRRCVVFISVACNCNTQKFPQLETKQVICTVQWKCSTSQQKCYQQQDLLLLLLVQHSLP